MSLLDACRVPFRIAAIIVHRTDSGTARDIIASRRGLNSQAVTPAAPAGCADQIGLTHAVFIPHRNTAERIGLADRVAAFRIVATRGGLDGVARTGLGVARRKTRRTAESGRLRSAERIPGHVAAEGIDFANVVAASCRRTTRLRFAVSGHAIADAIHASVLAATDGKSALALFAVSEESAHADHVRLPHGRVDGDSRLGVVRARPAIVIAARKGPVRRTLASAIDRQLRVIPAAAQANDGLARASGGVAIPDVGANIAAAKEVAIDGFVRAIGGGADVGIDQRTFANGDGVCTIVVGDAAGFQLAG